VYKLELIRIKKRPTITTGDMLLRLDSLLSQLPQLLTLIVQQHRGTVLKRSQDC